MQLVFEQVRLGGDRNFGYLLGDRRAKVAVIVDPAYAPELLVERAEAQGLRISHIINPHGHSDHIEGNPRAIELTGAPVAAFPGSAARPDVELQDGQSLAVGAFSVSFLHTPGHADDHLVLYESRHQILLTTGGRPRRMQRITIPVIRKPEPTSTLSQVPITGQRRDGESQLIAISRKPIRKKTKARVKKSTR
jgi:hypothetical protein